MVDDIAQEADKAFEKPDVPDELKEQYEGAYEERQEQQEAMLEAVRGEEEWTVDSWTWVSLNNAELEVREDVPGEVMRMLSADESNVDDGMKAGLLRALEAVMSAVDAEQLKGEIAQSFPANR